MPRKSDHLTDLAHGVHNQSAIPTQLSQIIHITKSMSSEHEELIQRTRPYGQYLNQFTANYHALNQTFLPVHDYTPSSNTTPSSRCFIAEDVQTNYSPPFLIDHQQNISDSTNYQHMSPVHHQQNISDSTNYQHMSPVHHQQNISDSTNYQHMSPVHHQQNISDSTNYQHMSSIHQRTSNPKVDPYTCNSNELIKLKINNVTHGCDFMQRETPPTAGRRSKWNTHSSQPQSRVITNNSSHNHGTSQNGFLTKYEEENSSDCNQHLAGLDTNSGNSVHSKTTRSRSYPINVCQQPYKNTPDSQKRHSLQLFYISRPFSNNTPLLNNNRTSSQSTQINNMVSLQPIDNFRTSPPGCSYHRCSQRTLSNVPKVHQVKRIVVESSNCGEIESEYVTIDHRYNLHGQCEPTSNYNGIPTEHSSPRLLSPLADCGKIKQIDHVGVIMAKMDPAQANSTFDASGSDKHSNSVDVDKINTVSEAASETPKRKGIPVTLHVVAKIDDPQFSNFKSSTSHKNSGWARGVSNGSNAINSDKSKNRRREKDIVATISRYKSLPDLLGEGTRNEAGIAQNYSDDEDGDHFGFLSYPISFSSSCSSAAMNKAKAKSPSPGNRMIPKRWRSKTKAVPAVSSTVAMWTPGPLGSCSWSSVSGRKVQLRPVSILNLTEPERMVLQKIAQSKLQSMEIGCPVSIPNENAEQGRAKKSSLSLKRRSKSLTTSSIDTMVKDGTASGLVFGIPLIKCLMNDRELYKQRRRCVAPGSSSSMKMRTDSNENLHVSRCARKSSSSSQGSLDIGGGMVSQKTEASPSHKRAASVESLSESESSRNTSSSPLDALLLSTSNPASRLRSLAVDGCQLASHSEAQVPYVVKACFKHIETYGLQTLGIFRVGCSKKRVKQLREEFDCGKNVWLTDEHNPHDVGALLKEYFRDLPDPLLTRELYLPFLHAERIKDEYKKHLALSLLISMLPVAHRDTLWALLQFLATVSQHAPDHTDEKGETVSGNKMDAHNLATLFGPNIIHRTKVEKSSDKEMMSESAERVEQSKEIIEVVKDMIDNHHELFEISGSLRDEALRVLMESNQEVTDKILRHIANQNQIETDPESMCSVFEDSPNSPMLYHSMNSDADLLAFAQKQTTDSHRLLRITKSANDSPDSPVQKSRVAILSESQAFSPASRDNHRATSFNLAPSSRQLSTNHNYPSPVSIRVPILRVYHDSTNSDEVFPGSSKVRNLECHNSDGFNKSLNIPQPQYFRKNSSSSTGSDISCFNGLVGSENGISGRWVLPTPPSSRNISPKPLFLSALSSSTLVASSAPSLLNYPQLHDSDYENNPPIGSAEWERDRWKLWEKTAVHKRHMETEQETLV